MSSKDRVKVNFFLPSTKSMRAEVAVARIVLTFWAILSFGVPTVIWLAGLTDPSGLGESFITQNRSLFGFPLHYWLLAQGCTIGYILLCKLYCLLWDKLVIRQRDRHR